MGVEIERKFLVKNDDWKNLGTAVLYRQGYISSDYQKIVRIRTAGEKAFLTIKSKSDGIKRMEYEYEIPFADGHELLETLCEPPIVEKTRTKIEWKGFLWEIDEFSGLNAGLVVAEIELPDEDTIFENPDWIGREVSEDKRYSNSNLIKMPFSKW